MQVVLFLLWGLVALGLLWSFARTRRRVPASTGPRPPLDELVKDPVCQTYVVRSRAVRRTNGGAPQYFCSDECARRYLAS